MSDEAKAAAVMVNLDTGDVKLVDLVTDDGTGMDPRFKCEQLWDSVRDDWPGWEVAYVANEAAHELAVQRRLWQIGMSDEDHMMPTRIEAYNTRVNGG